MRYRIITMDAGWGKEYFIARHGMVSVECSSSLKPTIRAKQQLIKHDKELKNNERTSTVTNQKGLTR